MPASTPQTTPTTTAIASLLMRLPTTSPRAVQKARIHRAINPRMFHPPHLKWRVANREWRVGEWNGGTANEERGVISLPGH